LESHDPGVADIIAILEREDVNEISTYVYPVSTCQVCNQETECQKWDYGDVHFH
jgi:hypothetical protein